MLRLYMKNIFIIQSNSIISNIKCFFFNLTIEFKLFCCKNSSIIINIRNKASILIHVFVIIQGKKEYAISFIAN
jgi:hypothetical protein